MRYYLEVEHANGAPKETRWAASEDEALEAVRTFLRQGAAILIFEAVNDPPDGP